VKRALEVPFFLDYDDGLGGRFANSPGLLPLIGYARRAGFDVPFIDNVSELLRVAEARDTDAIAFSSMERLLPRTIETARRIRELRPDLVLMLGGNSIEPFAVDLVAGLFDIVAVGEGDHVFNALLSALARSRGRLTPSHKAIPMLTLASRCVDIGPASIGALQAADVAALQQASFLRAIPGEPRRCVGIGVSGVFIRAAGRLLRLDAPTRDDFASAWSLTCGDAEVPQLSLSSSPLGEELDDLSHFPWEEWKRHDWATLEFYTQRGCRWGRCEFCSVGRRDVRQLSVDAVIATLSEAARRGVRIVSFSDDLFVQHKEWNRQLLERVIALDLGLAFRAQTMANRAMWSLLPLMRAAGFTELSFGVETLDSARATFMVKSYNGARYVDNALETIARVAEAGIRPVLYMIMADPQSTLRTITRELVWILEAVERIYLRTRVVPKLSYTLTLLPLAGTLITERLGYTVREVALEDRVLRFPNEFRFTAEVARYLQLAASTTHDMPYRRENLCAFPRYLDAARQAAQECSVANAALIDADVARGLQVFGRLASALDDDVEQTAHALLNGCEEAPYDQQHFDFGRFGGYIAGVQRYLELIDAGAHA
jgi:radical SAM superfamily enzyme YgiQ (UPF0313 family)